MRGHAITCAIVLCAAAAPAYANVEPCTLHYAFGTVRLAASDHAAGRYGADLRMLYGDWDWKQTFGLEVAVARTERYVADIAGLVRDCAGDLRHGRLDFTRHQVTDPGSQTPREESDAEFYDRALDDLVEVKRELATIENRYDALLRDHAPLVAPAPNPAIATLKGIVNDTVLRVLNRAADRTTGLGWIVVNIDALDHALDRFNAAHALTRRLIEVYLSQSPQLRDTVISQLINNTGAVVDQYGQFFSPERRAALQALLDQAAHETDDQDLVAVIAKLTVIANDLQTQIQGVWAAGGPLREIAAKLKFIFGNCDGATANHPLLSSQYFGDLPVAARIVQEGDDGPLCAR
jgi:hypothetical protein